MGGDNRRLDQFYPHTFGGLTLLSFTPRSSLANFQIIQLVLPVSYPINHF